MATEESIADVTASCLEHFDECLGVDSLMVDEWAENRLADFNIWIFSMGATARGRASLDSRLAARPGTQHIVIELLHLLDGLICQCKDFDQDAEAPDSASMPSDYEDPPEEDQSLEQDLPRSFSPWSDASETDDEQYSTGIVVPENPLLGKMKHIETILDQLARLSVAIRRSGNRSRLQKADQRLNPDEHQVFKEHLIFILLRRPGSTAELTEVQKRLIDANIRRRNRFIYAQTHANHLAITRGKPKSHHMVSRSIAGGISEDSNQGKPKRNLPTHSGAETTTTATAIDTSSILDITRFRAPGATTVMSSTVVNLKYPRPPRMKIDAKLFKCPCCCQALPAEVAENDRWKKHLADDIVPYTCVLQNCAIPDVLFPTKDAWRRHLEEHHCDEYWTCSICREDIELPDEESFVWHAKVQHADSISQDRIPVLAGLSRRSSPTEMKSCPICGWPQTDSATADKESLIEHVAKEVHAFSLRSLPWADGPEYATDGWTRENHEKVINWMWEIESSGQRPSLDLVSDSKPLAEPALSHMGYFQRNPYFADNSSRSSSEHTSAAARDHDMEDHQMTPVRSLSFERNSSRSSTSSEAGHGPSNKHDEVEVAADTQKDQAPANRGNRRCTVLGCPRKRVFEVLDTIRIMSLYCQDHTCEAPSSMLGCFCPKQRSPMDKFCLQHGKCSRQSCFLRAPRNISRDDFPWTCPQHAVERLLEAGEDRSRYSQLLTEEEDRRARAAAERERTRLAQEEADARRRTADKRFADALKRERLAKERDDEDRRRIEDEILAERRRREEAEIRRNFKDEVRRREEDETRRKFKDEVRRRTEHYEVRRRDEDEVRRREEDEIRRKFKDEVRRRTEHYEVRRRDEDEMKKRDDAEGEGTRTK